MKRKKKGLQTHRNEVQSHNSISVISNESAQIECDELVSRKNAMEKCDTFFVILDEKM